jgi:chitin synthase
LGAVVQDSQSHVDVEMPAEAADMNSIYEESLANVRDRIPVGHGNAKKVGQTIAEKEQAAKMYYANVKTNVLLAWVLSNVLFRVTLILNDAYFRLLRGCSSSVS